MRDGEHLTIRDDDEGMAVEMVRLFADPARVAAMAAAGRRVAEAEYSWDSVLPKLEPWLDTLAALPCISASAPSTATPTWVQPVLARGATENADASLPAMLGSVWSHPEPTHIWSLGGESVLRLKAAADCREVRLIVSGNPHVAGREQRLGIMVNGFPLAERPLPADGITTLAFDCATAPWRPGGVNSITLKPSPTTSCPEDARDMGLCLWRIETD